MDNVIPLFREEIWVCECGCATFQLYANGSAKCAHCMGVVEGSGSWFEEISSVSSRTDKTPFTDIFGNGSSDFSRARIARLAAAKDLVMMALAMEDGTVTVWNAAQTPEQARWVVRKMRQLKRLMRRQLIGSGHKV